MRQTLATVRGMGMQYAKHLGLKVFFRRLKALITRTKSDTFYSSFKLLLNILGIQAVQVSILEGISNRKSVWTIRTTLDYIAEKHPDLVNFFVKATLRNSRDPSVLFVLSRHPTSKPLFRDWLAGVNQSQAVDQLVDRDAAVTAAFAGAARFLLAPADAGDLEENLESKQPELTSFFRSTSKSFKFSVSEQEPVSESAPRRLVITEDFSNVDQLSLLVSGTSHCTFFAFNDLYARADFRKVEAWCESGAIQVEHARSRIGRFTARYIDIKEQCGDLAKKIRSLLGEIPAGELVGPFLEQEIADFLFFRTLKIEAVRSLTQDANFDEIVVALDRQTVRADFVFLLSSCEELLSDPRLSFVSIATRTIYREKFLLLVDVILGGAQPKRVFESDSSRIEHFFFPPRATVMRHQVIQKPKGRRQSNWVILATADRVPYNFSTASYARSFSQQFRVSLLTFGVQAVRLRKQLDRLGLWRLPLNFVAPSIKSRDFGERLGERLVRLSHLNLDFRSNSAKAAFVTGAETLCNRVILPSIANAQTIKANFSKLEQLGSLPSAVVLTPNREPRVAMIANIARAFGIPTVALEPHLIEPSYSRYAKVRTDYYGVVSRYIKDRVWRPYGIPEDRVFAIGSPKFFLHDIAGGNPIIGRQKLFEFSPRTPRNNLDRSNLVFFSQPGSWETVGKVWDLILDATKQTRVNVLLKPHPEDSSTRVEEFLLRANVNHHRTVELLEGDAAKALKKADYATVMYSAMGLESSLRGIPTFCIAPGGHEYPLDLHAMVGIPRVTESRELKELLCQYSRSRAGFDITLSKLCRAEPQFVDGFESGLLQLMDLVISRGKRGLRPPGDIPESLFLDPPHPVFQL